jgi:LysR family transcriptional regulator, benzoate and cis,cis-muconate-responsive activator of ben and cat genes
METQHLRLFCVLAEELHFTRASVLLNVSQPSLSHQIKQLEDELGTRLLERTNRRVRLTEAGEVFLVRAARILEQMDQAVREATRIGKGETGSLGIGVVSTAVCSYLPEMLRTFRRESPHLNIDIHEMEPGEQVDALRKETIDIGLLFLSIQDPDLDSILVSRERLIAAIPTGHAAAAKEKLQLRDLAGETFLIPRQQSIPGFHELALDTLRSNGVAAPRVQPTRLLTTAAFLVSGQLGVALVPESFRQHLRIRGCVYREISGPPVHADLIGLWRRKDRTPGLRRFIQLLNRESRKTASP